MGSTNTRRAQGKRPRAISGRGAYELTSWGSERGEGCLGTHATCMPRSHAFVHADFCEKMRGSARTDPAVGGRAIRRRGPSARKIAGRRARKWRRGPALLRGWRLGRDAFREDGAERARESGTGSSSRRNMSRRSLCWLFAHREGRRPTYPTFRKRTGFLLHEYASNLRHREVSHAP